MRGSENKILRGSTSLKLEYRFSTRWTEHWLITPSFGLGSFDNGLDVKLGSKLGFRSGLKSFIGFTIKCV